jgi:hypothetical protein
MAFAKDVLSIYENDVNIIKVIENSVDFIEKNDVILKYGDIHLYEHQKQLFHSKSHSTAY